MHWEINISADVRTMCRKVLFACERRQFRKIAWTLENLLQTLQPLVLIIPSSFALKMVRQLAEDEKSQYSMALIIFKKTCTRMTYICARHLLIILLIKGYIKRLVLHYVSWYMITSVFGTLYPLNSRVKDFEKYEFNVLSILWIPVPDNFYCEVERWNKMYHYKV